MDRLLYATSVDFWRCQIVSNPGCFRLLPAPEHEVAGSAALCRDRDRRHLCQSAVAGPGRERCHPQEEAHRQRLSCLRLQICPYFLLVEEDLYLATSLILRC